MEKQGSVVFSDTLSWELCHVLGTSSHPEVLEA